MNWLAYNYAHDVKRPGTTGDAVGFFMYPQAEVSGSAATAWIRTRSATR